MPYKDPEEKRASDLRYRTRNRERVAEVKARWQSANKERTRAAQRKWRQANPEKQLAASNRWRVANIERVRDLRKARADRKKATQQMAQWRAANSSRNKGNAARWAARNSVTNPQYRISRALRRRLYDALHGRTKAGSAVTLLGCPVAQVKAHLEDQWTVGMSWETYGKKGWHIDHIVPLTAFDLTDPEQLAKACHYTNLQPLWWDDNLRKGDK